MSSKGQNNYPVSSIKTQPRSAVYLGAWVQGFWENDTKTLNTSVLSDFEEAIDTKMALANIYSEWEYLENKSLITNLNTISKNGWVPIISSNPYFFKDCPEDDKSLYATIASGECDEFLRAAGKNLKSYNKPVFFRFAWEMNLPDMYWSIEKTSSTPEDFVNAWRRIYRIWEEQKVENVVWVLSFNTSHAKTVPYKDLYPGDEYVDWVAIDGYNWGDSHDWSGWADFNGVFRNSYNELVAVTEKPIMLSEVNSAESGGDKAKWLDDMLSKQIPESFPAVEAIVFFNENKQDGESVDWRIEKSEKYIDAVKKGLSNKLYKRSYP